MNCLTHHNMMIIPAAMVALLGVVIEASAVVASEVSDARARSAIFGDETLAANITQLKSQTAQLAPDARFERLVGWVLPSQSHDQFRFSAEFTQTGPIPSLRSDDPTDEERLRLAAELGMRRVPTGGRLVSPVFDLINAARDAGKLDALRNALRALQSADEVQQRCRLVLLAMTEIARGEVIAALPLVDEIEARHRMSTFPHLVDRWPETLLLSVGIEHPPLRDPCDAMLQRIIANQIRVSHHAGPLAWDQWILTLPGRIKYLQEVELLARTGQSPAPFGLPAQLTQWSSVSAGDEATYAFGLPTSYWHRFDDRVEKLSGHRDEYLYYCSPLRGDYEVECDISGFGHREGQLTVGGNWIWLHYNLKEFMIGGLRGQTGTLPLVPRLSEVNDWVHYRSVVRDGVCRAYINGRLLQTEKSRDTQFPWLAIRSPHWAATSVRDIRITGSPQIPDRIELSSDPELSGWVRYHLDSVGGPNDDWRFDPSLGPNGGLTARRKAEFSGMFQESLLRYHRPLLEDGIIEYEFEYQPGQIDVAPALGRQAFLLEPAGVRRHWITDGVWDSSGLDPLNSSESLSGIPCPLRPGWNKLRMSVTGDTVTLAVNDQTVLRSPIDLTDSRMFGLFHFADQTQVRVRNLDWSGNWPKTLPALRDQELRDQKLDELDRQLTMLKDSVEIDLVERRVQSQLKSRTDNSKDLSFENTMSLWSFSDSGESCTWQPEGLLMTRAASQNYNDLQASVRHRVVGDFDIIAEFADLQVETPADGNSTIHLVVVVDDPLKTHCRVWHGVYAHPMIDRRRVSQIEFNRFRPSGVEISFDGLAAEDSDSGKLRIARIGRRMYFMIAEEDSPTFRLLHTADIGDTRLQFNGIRLLCGTYDNQNPPAGGVRVTWKKVSIRADQVIPLAAPANQPGAK